MSYDLSRDKFDLSFLRKNCIDVLSFTISATEDIQIAPHPVGGLLTVLLHFL